ncbi:hypothetical protein TNCV_1294531, partial [Trichonephila clavipes]
NFAKPRPDLDFWKILYFMGHFGSFYGGQKGIGLVTESSEFRKTETRFRFLVKFRVKWVTLVSFYGGQKKCYWLGHRIDEFRKTETRFRFLVKFRVKLVTLVSSMVDKKLFTGLVTESAGYKNFAKPTPRFRFLENFRVKWVTLVSFYGGQKSYWLGHRIVGILGVQRQRRFF